MATVALGSGKQTGEFLLWSRGDVGLCLSVCLSARPEGRKPNIPGEKRDRGTEGQTAPAGQVQHSPGAENWREQEGFFPEFIPNIPELPIQGDAIPMANAVCNNKLFPLLLSSPMWNMFKPPECDTEQGSHFKKLPEQNKTNVLQCLWAAGMKFLVQGWCQCCVHPLPRALHLWAEWRSSKWFNSSVFKNCFVTFGYKSEKI